MIKKYEELDFTDDFMFCKVLTNNPELCRELLELIIEKKVGQFIHVEKQKPIEITADGKGVRFDVYSEDDQNVVYDCEMQTSNGVNLPKRSRYYQGMIDLNLIERGEDYSKLKKSYVIFICTFDVFEKGLHKYTFKNYCKEFPELELNDETTKIFLCAGGDADDVSPEMKEFLDWMAGNGSGNTELIRELSRAVQKVRDHEEWRMEYMTLLMRDKEMREEGRKEGIKEGIKEGEKKGREEGLLVGKAEEIVETGYEFGLTEADILKRLQSKLNITEEQAKEYLKRYGK